MTAPKCPDCENGFATVGKWESGLPRLVPHLDCNMTGFVQQTPAEQSWRKDIRERAKDLETRFEEHRETLRHEIAAEMDRAAARTIARLEGIPEPKSSKAPHMVIRADGSLIMMPTSEGQS